MKLSGLQFFLLILLQRLEMKVTFNSPKNVKEKKFLSHSLNIYWLSDSNRTTLAIPSAERHCSP